MVTVLSIALAAPLLYAAARKLSHDDDVVASYARVGVPEQNLNRLAVVLVAGAAGLIAGLVWAPIGIAATIGVICYFVLAVGAHFRYRDVRPLPTPVLILLIAVALLALRVADA
jgi:DoxX-like protein